MCPFLLILASFSWFFFASDRYTEHENHLEDLFEQKLLGPIPRDSVVVGLDGAWEFLFLASNQVTLTVLVQGPQFENRCIAEIY